MRYNMLSILFILFALLLILFGTVYVIYGSCSLNDELNTTVESYYTNVTSGLIDSYNDTIEAKFSDPWGYALIRPAGLIVVYDNGSWNPESMNLQKILDWFNTVFPEAANTKIVLHTGNETTDSAFLGSAVYGYMWNTTIEVPARDECRVLRFIVATHAVWSFNHTMKDRNFIIAVAFYDEQDNLIGSDFIGYDMTSREGDYKLIMHLTSYPGCGERPSLVDVEGDGVIKIRAEIIVYATEDPGAGKAKIGVYALGYLEVLPCS